MLFRLNQEHKDRSYNLTSKQFKSLNFYENLHIRARTEIRVNFERLSRPQFLPEFKKLLDLKIFLWNAFITFTIASIEMI